MKFIFRGKSSGFLYWFGKTLLPWQLSNQFRRINLNGLETIPSDTPVLIAANHPTAFVDPVLLGVFSQPPLFFMTRGDIFNKPLAKKVFESFNMFPVKRSRDGFTDLDRLDEMTQYVLDSMEDRSALCIFVEGMHHYDKRLLSIQKGIARIAFASYEKFKQDDLQIIPVGFAYWTTDQPRDVASLNVGKPIFVKDYWESYQNQPAQATYQLCKDIYEAIKPLCLHIESPEDDKLAERLLQLQRGEHPIGYYPVIQYNNTFFEHEKKVTEWVNAMPPEEKATLKKNAKHYLNRLKAAQISDEALLHPEWAGVSRWIFLALCFPFFVIGLIARYPIGLLSNYMVQNKIRKREFKSSIHLGVEFFIGGIWMLLLMITAFVSQKAIWIGIALSLPILYWFSIIYTEIADRTIKAYRALHHPDRQSLLQERKQL